MKIPRVKAGDPISDMLFNKLIDAANAANLNVGDGASLNMSNGPDGYTLDAVIDQPIWGQTTAGLSSGAYPFKQIFPDASGAWVDGTLTDVAFEINANASVATGKRALFYRTAQGEFFFSAGTC